MTPPLKDVWGVIKMTGGTGTQTGLPPFSNYQIVGCSCEDATTPYQACKASLTSNTVVAVAGNSGSSDTVKYHCFGN